MEDLVLVEAKDYAQVIFEDVSECYSINQPLECVFSLNELLKADSADWIGIYKVGFTNYKEFICKSSLDLTLLKDSDGKVVFQVDQLPKEDGEFYQFVYVSQANQIRGASIPFQFKKTHLSDFIEIEESEAVVFKSKESAINETIQEIQARCDHLTQANETYERLIKENEDLIRILKEEVVSIKSRNLRTSLDNERLTHALKAKLEEISLLNDQLAMLKHDNQILLDKVENLNKEKQELNELLRNENENLEKFKKNMENDKLDQISKLEKQIVERIDDLNKLKESLKHNEDIVGEQTKTIQAILLEKENSDELVKKLEKEKSDLECVQESLNQELSMCKDKLSAVEQCKELLRIQITSLRTELDAANQKISFQQTSIQDLLEKEKKHEQEKADFFAKIDKFKSDYDSKMQETNGSYFALKMAHSHLENKIKTLDQTKSKAEKENEINLKAIQKLKSENEELKDRLKAGGKEYTKLFEKYRHIKNRQYNPESSVYYDLNASFHTPREQNVFSQLLESDRKINQATVLENFKKDDDIFSSTFCEPEPVKTCDICNYIFSTDSSANEIEKHYSSHYGPVCPVCCLGFKKGHSQQDFENHVNSHFTN